MKTLCLIIAIFTIIECVYRNIIDILRKRKYTQLISSDNNFFSLSIYIFSFAVVFVSSLGLVIDPNTEEFPFALYFTAAAVHFVFIFICPKIVYFGRDGFQCGYFKLRSVPYEEITLVDFKQCYLPFGDYAETTIVTIEANYKGYKGRISNRDATLVRTWIDIAQKKKSVNIIEKDSDKKTEAEIDITEVCKPIYADSYEINSTIQNKDSDSSKQTLKSHKKILLLLYIISFLAYVCFGASVAITFFNPTNVYNEMKGNDLVVSTTIERKPLDTISAVKTDEANNIYIFYEQTNIVNVYNCDGKFQYSVIAPRRGKNGSNGIEVNNGNLYIMNMKGDIFQFKDGKHLKSYIYEKDYSYETYEERELYLYFDIYEEPAKHVIKTNGSNDSNVTIYNNSTEVYSLKEGKKEYIVHRNIFIKLFGEDRFTIDALLIIIGIISGYLINRLKKNDKNE